MLFLRLIIITPRKDSLTFYNEDLHELEIIRVTEDGTYRFRVLFTRSLSKLALKLLRTLSQ